MLVLPTLWSPNTWDGSRSSDWNTTDNWSGNYLPTYSNYVTIPNIVPIPVISSGANAKCYSITLQDGATITINGNLEVEN
jgi:hypothetical protein